MDNAVPDSTVPEAANTQPHYGLTNDGNVVVLPAAEYASGAVHRYQAACAERNEEPVNFPVVLNEVQYQFILDNVESELDDIDGDGLVPHYMFVSFDGEQPVFPHASVNTPEAAAAFVADDAMELVGPFLLTDVRDHWPVPRESLPASQVGLINR